MIDDLGALPLAGIRVVELAQIQAGPICTMLLADLGADVIKIEQPGKGDIARSMGRQFSQGESAIYMSLNRNKRDITVDLRQVEGKEIALQLIDKADVFVENFRPGTMRKWGLDYETVSARNPRIVYCSISAFGQTGPYSRRAANDLAIQAMSGAMSMTGSPDRLPSRQGTAVPDSGAGSMACAGVLASLIRQQRTGRGEKIEVSLLDAQLFLLVPREGEYFMSGKEPERSGDSNPMYAPYDAFLASDGSYFHVQVFTEKFWNNLCVAIEQPELVVDPRFETNELRCVHREALMAILRAVFASRPRAEWLAIMEEHDVPSAPINTLGEAIVDPQVRHNGMVVDLPHSKLGHYRTFGTPIKLHHTPIQFKMGPPTLGEHTDEVLRELGYTDQSIAAMRAKGVV